jgi:hypothetical protein
VSPPGSSVSTQPGDLIDPAVAAGDQARACGVPDADGHADPGFTRLQSAPSQSPLAPRVLQFADTYEPEDESAVVDGDD